MSCYSSLQIDQDQDTKDQETRTFCARPPFIAPNTQEKVSCVCIQMRGTQPLFIHKT
jgi:hypothetical protein